MSYHGLAPRWSLRRISAVVGNPAAQISKDAAAGGWLGVGNFSVGVGTIGSFFFSSHADNLAVVDSVICLVLRGRMGNQMM
jgi:hypothetical protein